MGSLGRRDQAPQGAGRRHAAQQRIHAREAFDRREHQPERLRHHPLERGLHRGETPGGRPQQELEKRIGDAESAIGARIARQIEGRRAVAREIGQREDDQHQRDAVADHVMHAPEEDGAPAVAVQQPELPERMGAIERARELALDRRRERRVVARLGETLLDQVPMEIEVGVFGPDEAVAVRLVARHPLAEAADLRQALGERLRRLLPGDLARERQHAVDVHQVGRVVHPEPGDVDRGERRATLACS